MADITGTAGRPLADDAGATPDTAGLQSPDYDAHFGEARWGGGAQCRWRNIRIKDLPTGSLEVAP